MNLNLRSVTVSLDFFLLISAVDFISGVVVLSCVVFVFGVDVVVVGFLVL